MEKKKNLLIYTGHNELIGGDAYYIFNIINRIDLNKFNVELYTDVNKLFKSRADAWLKVDVPIYYLNTRRELFKKFWFDSYYENLASSNSTKYKNISFSLLNISIGRFKVFNFLRFIFKRIAFRNSRWRLANFAVFYKLFKKKKGNIDIFHFNNGGYPAKEAGLSAILIARLFRVKNIIMTFHNVPQKRSIFRPTGYIYDLLIPKSCYKIISASDMIGSKIMEYRNFPKNKLVTIRCGLDSVKQISESRIKQIKLDLKINSSRRIIIISGNIEEKRKGHEQLFQAIAVVKKELPDILLLVIGDGTQSRMDFLENYVRELEIQENVRFLGYRTDIYELNSIAEITLTPSVGVESIPFTILEGARLSKPVITTTVGACAEGVKNNISGFVVKPYDINALAEKIIVLLKDEKLRIRMGEKGKEYFNERFLLKKAVIEHQDLYLKTTNN